MPLFRVTYNRWYLDRQQNWDFDEEVDFFHAENGQRAIAMASGPRIDTITAREATPEERQRYLAEAGD